MHIKDRSLNNPADLALSGLEGVVQNVKNSVRSKSYPPVEKWNPPYCGKIGLRILRNGTWVYQGSPIGRKRLVKLFASVLRKDEDGQTYLVTPVEKVGIEVDDAPFLAVELTTSGEGREQILSFRTNLDEEVHAGLQNPINFVEEAETGGLKPYILIRGRLEALLTRALYYELINLASVEAGKFGIWSGGAFFKMADADDDLYSE